MTVNENDLRHIKSNVENIKSQIEIAANRVSKGGETIEIIGVTKNRTIAEIEAAIKAGINCIGENRVQEAERTIPAIREQYKEFHFIGHLQSNKINKLMLLNPALIHSIDSMLTAERLNRYLERHNKNQAILVQVNCSGEESKYGLKDDFAKTKDFVTKCQKLSNLSVKGLMTIAPHTDDEERIRASFVRLREHFELLNREGVIKEPLSFLSMGMSHDYKIAIEEGANMVRIGSAIFDRQGYSVKTEEM